MKKILIALYLFSVVLSSCFKDESNKEISVVNPIVIDLNGKSNSLSVYMMDTLEIKPLTYKEGTDDAKLSFNWRIQGNTIVPIDLGSSMNLKAKMNFPPQSLPYSLVFTVTDNETSIQRSQLFNVTVFSSFVQGIVVADTRDEKNSDLTIVASENFNTAIEQDGTKIFKDVYSSVNGQKIEGLVKDIKTTSYGTNRTLTVATENSLLRADHYDYVLIESECNENMFIIPPKREEIKPSMIVYDNVYGQDILINGGKFYSRSCQNGNRKYDFYSYSGGRYEYNVSHVVTVDYYGIWMFDTIEENFMFFQYDKMVDLKPQSTEGLFDLNNFKGWEPLILGQSGTNDIDFIMRNKSTGEIKDFIINKEVDNGNNLPKDIIDLSSVASLKRADYFALNSMEKRLYFVVDNELRTVSLDNLREKTQFIPKVGEKITSIKVWDDVGGNVRYKNLDPQATTPDLKVAIKNRAVVLTTYNESTKEGKVIVIPIPILNGDLEQDPNYHVEYGGFGRILSVRKQDK